MIKIDIIKSLEDELKNDIKDINSSFNIVKEHEQMSSLTDANIIKSIISEEIKEAADFLLDESTAYLVKKTENFINDQKIVNKISECLSYADYYNLELIKEDIAKITERIKDIEEGCVKRMKILETADIISKEISYERFYIFKAILNPEDEAILELYEKKVDEKYVSLEEMKSIIMSVIDTIYINSSINVNDIKNEFKNSFSGGKEMKHKKSAVEELGKKLIIIKNNISEKGSNISQLLNFILRDFIEYMDVVSDIEKLIINNKDEKTTIAEIKLNKSKLESKINSLYDSIIITLEKIIKNFGNLSDLTFISNMEKSKNKLLDYVNECISYVDTIKKLITEYEKSESSIIRNSKALTLLKKELSSIVKKSGLDLFLKNSKKFMEIEFSKDSIEEKIREIIDKNKNLNLDEASINTLTEISSYYPYFEGIYSKIKKTNYFLDEFNKKIDKIYSSKNSISSFLKINPEELKNKTNILDLLSSSIDNTISEVLYNKYFFQNSVKNNLKDKEFKPNLVTSIEELKNIIILKKESYKNKIEIIKSLTNKAKKYYEFLNKIK